VHNGRSRSSKVTNIYTNRNLCINFLLVTNSNFGRILHRFQDIAAQRSKNRFFALPTLLWGPCSGTPSEFLNETYPAETRGTGLLYGENCIILTSNAFDWSTRVTDGQTELPWHNIIRAMAYMLSRVKTKWKNKKFPVLLSTTNSNLYSLIITANMQIEHITNFNS